MESLDWLQINKKEKWVAFRSIDALAILPALRNRDFRILVMLGYGRRKRTELTMGK